MTKTSDLSFPELPDAHEEVFLAMGEIDDAGLNINLATLMERTGFSRERIIDSMEFLSYAGYIDVEGLE